MSKKYSFNYTVPQQDLHLVGEREVRKIIERQLGRMVTADLVLDKEESDEGVEYHLSFAVIDQDTLRILLRGLNAIEALCPEARSTVQDIRRALQDH